MKKVVIPLADGFEEIEALATADILKRAGVDVVLAGVPGTMVKGR
ncbi:MAG: DJ-1/PfpI family protein, partial [Candidatus Aenigmatarchaeota archaeon]